MFIAKIGLEIRIEVISKIKSQPKIKEILLYAEYNP